jgi:hypothetical protein
VRNASVFSRLMSVPVSDVMDSWAGDFFVEAKERYQSTSFELVFFTTVWVILFVLAHLIG